MGQPAYDASGVRRRKAPQTQRKVPLRVEKGGKRRLTTRQAVTRYALQLISMALLVGFAVSLLWSEAQLVEVNDQIQKAKAQLVSEQSQYTYYNSRTSGPDEDGSEPDHLYPAGQRERTGAQGVCCSSVDGFPARWCHDHSGIRQPGKIRDRWKSVRQRTLF